MHSLVRWLYRHVARGILFAQDSEVAHERTLRMLAWSSQFEATRDLANTLLAPPPLPSQLFGLTFPNPVGLAAGMDKQAAALPMWPCLGFGFSELGGVTMLPQPGNPKPRMFRAPADEALVNRMGFNNPGAHVFADTLSQWKSSGLWPSHPVGVNLGKSKVTPLSQAAQDYATTFQALKNLADFFVVNVSSPNTPNLRQLQDKKALAEILQALQALNQPSPKPILVKLAPDLSWDALNEVLELVEPCSIAGIVASNTTLSRPPSSDPICQSAYQQSGGLSGRPLQQRSTEIIAHLYKQTQGRIPIIGVGGIFSAQDAWDKITAGASLIQIYTGLVYQGPSLPKDIVLGLITKLKAAGFHHLQEAIGSANISPIPSTPK